MARKWFLQAIGLEGLNNLLVAYEDKSAQAVCTFAYCEGPDHEPLIFEGRVIVRLKNPTHYVLTVYVRAGLSLPEVQLILVCQPPGLRHGERS